MNRSIRKIRNLFTYRMLRNKLAVKQLRTAKFCAMLLVSVILAGIFSLSPAISTPINEVIITNTGRIATPTAVPTDYRSEIRGVFIHEPIFAYPHDWNMIAETLASYKINRAYCHFVGSPFGIRPATEIQAAIDAFHPRGIEVHSLVCTVYYNQGQTAYVALDSNLNPTNWNCPIKIRNEVKSTVEAIAAFDIDGLMLDYARYPIANICYCDQCKAEFEEWLGETITVWPGDFAPEGSRYKEFMEWRIVPITELVRDIQAWTSAVRQLLGKPELEMSGCVWASINPAGRRYWLGQDAADWVGKGYIDLLSPMIYEPLESIPIFIDTARDYWVAGPEGKVPLVIFLTNGITSALPVSQFKESVEIVRNMGCDGWIIWRYGGPGIESGGELIDITPYLDAIDLPQTFGISSIQVSVGESQATITWTTDLSATSIVEYNRSSLFNVSFKYNGAIDFHYWDVDHNLGIIVGDGTLVTNHSITLIGLLSGTKYYFRVQSEDSSGARATSRVFTFATG